MKKLLFIHIAKTAGASIRRMMNTMEDEISYDCLHNQTLIIKTNQGIKRQFVQEPINYEKYQLIAYFVRNPYERLRSCYTYFYRGGMNQYSINFYHGDEQLKQKIHDEFPSFMHCCQQLDYFSQLIPHAIPMSETIPRLPENDNIFHGRYENKKDVIRFFSHLGITVTEKEVLHINASLKPPTVQYTDEMKALVCDFYQEDFKQFGYER